LGITQSNFDSNRLDRVSGFHVHNLCGHNSDALLRTLGIIEKRFGQYLHQVEWLNLGGGHVITKQEYDVELLCNEINRIHLNYLP
jgi:carboxynorspermidine decarboxylase